MSYSVWLKPAPDSAFGRQLAKLVARHAAELSTPAFAPHVTLLGGFTADDDVRAAACCAFAAAEARSCVARRTQRCARRERWRTECARCRRRPGVAPRLWDVQDAAQLGVARHVQHQQPQARQRQRAHGEQLVDAGGRADRDAHRPLRQQLRLLFGLDVAAEQLGHAAAFVEVRQLANELQHALRNARAAA